MSHAEFSTVSNSKHTTAEHVFSPVIGYLMQLHKKQTRNITCGEHLEHTNSIVGKFAFHKPLAAPVATCAVEAAVRPNSPPSYGAVQRIDERRKTKRAICSVPRTAYLELPVVRELRRRYNEHWHANLQIGRKRNIKSNGEMVLQGNGATWRRLRARQTSRNADLRQKRGNYVNENATTAVQSKATH